ncbi:MAG: hypothetical protein P4L91_17115 [Burkholderiaceae bacterium]|nr:hypothetical protein [Burkholderiaceae bacterium]
MAIIGKFLIIPILILGVSIPASATKKDPSADSGGGPVSGPLMDESTGAKGIIKTAGPAADAKAEKTGKEAAKEAIERSKTKSPGVGGSISPSISGGKPVNTVTH